jgi:hypothetical protein
MTKEELALKETIIDKLIDMINQQVDEMKTLKTVISIPVLRNHLNQFEFRGGVRFEDLLE